MVDAWTGPLNSETPEDDPERIPSEVSLGDGHVLKFNEEVFRAMLHRPETVQAVTAASQAICDWANSNVAMSPEEIERLGKGKPAYKFVVQKDPDTHRARGRVYPANRLGIYDEATHQTLYKAWASHPSDPIPTPEELGVTETSGEIGETGNIE